MSVMEYLDNEPLRALAWALVGLCLFCGVLLWRLAKAELVLSRLRVEVESIDRELGMHLEAQKDLLKSLQFLEVAHLKHENDRDVAARMFLRHDERLVRLEAGVVVIAGNRARAARSPGGTA